MRKKRILCVLLMWVMMSAMEGCNVAGGNIDWEAQCVVKLQELPAEYDALPKEIRKDTEITVEFRGESNGKEYEVKLTEKSNFERTIDLQPDTYSVKASVEDEKLCCFDVKVSTETIKVSKDSAVELVIEIEDTAGFVAAMAANLPDDEILQADFFSRQVQLDGKIVDLESIRSIAQFPVQESAFSSNLVEPGETKNIQSASHPGVFLIVKNQNEWESVKVDEATVIGVGFEANRVVFPGGITLGMPVAEIVHADR